VKYEYPEDAKETLESGRRRGALNALREALVNELEAERLGRVKQVQRFGSERRQAAAIQLTDMKRRADRSRRKADKLLTRVEVPSDDLRELEREQLESLLMDNERDHALRTAELDLLKDELSTLDDQDEIDAQKAMIQLKQEERSLVEIGHEVLLERRAGLPKKKKSTAKKK
jgi:hypothetical protein